MIVYLPHHGSISSAAYSNPVQAQVPCRKGRATAIHFDWIPRNDVVIDSITAAAPQERSVTLILVVCSSRPHLDWGQRAGGRRFERST